jgi:hypothetical protein
MTYEGALDDLEEVEKEEAQIKDSGKEEGENDEKTSKELAEQLQRVMEVREY